MKTSRILLLIVSVSFALLMLSACAGTQKTQQGKQSRGFFGWFKKAIATPEDDPVSLSKEAMGYFSKGRYMLAEEIFQKIRDRYPFSPYATLAELRLADCKFYQGLYEEAIPLYQEFEKLHPTNEAVSYVIFQEGSCYYRLMASADRDQTYTHQMIETYRRLLRRYPDNPYSYEAQKRIEEGRNRLAQHEVVVAKWYLRTNQLPQAKMRLETAVELYPETPAAKEARKILAGKLKDVSLEQAANQIPWWERMLP